MLDNTGGAIGPEYTHAQDGKRNYEEDDSDLASGNTDGRAVHAGRRGAARRA